MRNDSNDALLCLEIGNDKGGLSYSIPAQVLVEGDPMGCRQRACGDSLGGYLRVEMRRFYFTFGVDRMHTIFYRDRQCPSETLRDPPPPVYRQRPTMTPQRPTETHRDLQRPTTPLRGPSETLSVPIMHLCTYDIAFIAFTPTLRPELTYSYSLLYQ